MMHGESEGRMSGETTTGEDGPTLFFKYGDNDLPAYRASQNSSTINFEGAPALRFMIHDS